MKRKYTLIFVAVVVIAFLTVAGIYLAHSNIQVLNPKGPIAEKERNLIYIALGLSLIVVLPVYGLTIAFVIRYREGNKKAKYSPHLQGNWILETIWWLIPTAIISVLAVIAWNSSHTLDPYVPIASKNKAMVIQVIALDWKWLFVYPKLGIASVNYLQIPKDVPIDFNVTADAPMNSFWIPQLGGQIYAMPGMSTQLNLMATSYGEFYGSSANISGNGFSGMNFMTRSSSMGGFNSWVKSVESKENRLTLSAYAQLARPSMYNPVSYYSKVKNGLYLDVINKYMMPIEKSSSGLNSSYSTNMGMGMSM
ncbi:MAG TPA: COX aromatic rich motif-containing protein [Candidatus Sulfotelmatobacter sp.]|nr:COX aromatic rich motif-containing protein [Candidatus Sulfotelmatobacter sp.]